MTNERRCRSAFVPVPRWMKCPFCRAAQACLLLALTAALSLADAPEAHGPEAGIVYFQPAPARDSIPERYWLSAHTFPYQLEWQHELPHSGLDIYHLHFPSPVETVCPENNTVHAEYYRPRGPGPFPAVIVLDITAGNQMVSRLIATHLAQNGIAGLFVQMAYYGARRPPGSSLRLLSPNVQQTMDAVRQTVLDLRRATAWLETRPEIDPHRVGILGTSLGSLMAALTAEMEPKLTRVVVLLGGGGLVDAFYDHPQAAGARKAWEWFGGSKAKLEALLAPVDPLTCAANLRNRRLLMIGAARDEIIPRRATDALWNASGRQKIVWYDCTHYGAALYFLPALGEIVQHVRD